MTSSSPKLPHQLLLHHKLVEQIAGRLARDEADAQDVTQDVWLDALNRPPRHLDSARSWLARVVTRKAWHQAKRRRRQEDQELQGYRDALASSPVELLAAEEVQDQLRSAVDALPAQYREAVCLRYYEGLGHREIANRIGVPIETIRSRLKRGLVQLREGFETEGVLDRSRWCLALAYSVRKERASHGLPEFIVSRAGPALFLTVGKWAALAGLLILAFSVGFRAVRTATTVSATVGGTDPQAAIETAPQAMGQINSERQRLDRIAIQSAERIQLEAGVTVLRRSDRSPLAGVQLELTLLGDPQAETLLGTTDSEGRLGFSELLAGNYLVQSDRGYETHARARHGQKNEFEHLIDGEQFISGCTQTSRGMPKPSIEIWAFRNDDFERGWLAGISDSSGMFLVEGLDAGCSLGLRSKGFTDGHVVRLSGVLGADSQPGASGVNLRLGPSARELGGRVTDIDGNPLVGAEVRTVSPRTHHLPSFLTSGWITLPPPEPVDVTDEQGEFLLRGVSNWRSSLVQAHHKGFRTQSIAIGRRGLDSTTRLKFALDRGTVVRGNLTRSDGLALENLRVQARNLASDESTSALCMPDGSYSLSGLEPQEYELTVIDPMAPGGPSALRRFDLTEVLELNWNPVLEAGAALFGRIILYDREDLLGTQLRLIRPDTSEGEPLATLREDTPGATLTGEGRFAFATQVGATYELELWPAGNADAPLQRWSNLSPSMVELELRCEDSARNKCGFQGRIVGNRPSSHRLELWSSELSRPRLVVEDRTHGRFEMEDLWPGTYLLIGSTPGQAASPVREFVLTAGASLDLGEVRIPNAGRIVVSLVGSPEAIAIAKKCTANLAGDFGEAVSFMLGRHSELAQWNSETEFTIPGLAPGEYLLTLAGRQTARSHRLVTITEGEIVRFEQPVEIGQLLNFKLQLPAPEGSREGARLVLRDGTGRLLIRHIPVFKGASDSSRELLVQMNIPVGQWSLKAFAQGAIAESQFSVPRSADVVLEEDQWDSAGLGPGLQLESESLKALYKSHLPEPRAEK